MNRLEDCKITFKHEHHMLDTTQRSAIQIRTPYMGLYMAYDDDMFSYLVYWIASLSVCVNLSLFEHG